MNIFRFFFLASFLICLSAGLGGCSGTLLITGLDDDDSASDDDDAAGDDDDAVGDDDDTAGDDDDTVGDDDDTVGDDDDTVGDDDDTAGDDDDTAGDDDDTVGDDDDAAPGDFDGDGWLSDEDCDDTDPTLNLDDADSDGSSTCDGDCNDGNAGIFPGALESCDQVDTDCDGLVWPGEFLAHATFTEGYTIFWNDGGQLTQDVLDPAEDGLIYSVVVGDFNGDGAQDAISARNGLGSSGQFNEGFADIMWGDCDSEDFTEENLSTSGAGFEIDYWEEVFSVSDVDNDGDLDVLGLDYRTGEGVTWLNDDGLGGAWSRVTGTSSSTFAYNWSGQDTSIFEGLSTPPTDIDGDGILDLINCESTFSDNVTAATCEVVYGEGNGLFQQDSSFVLEQEVVGLVAADFDGDGAVDIVGGLDDDGNSGAAWIWFGSMLTPGFYSGPGSLAFDLVAGSTTETNDAGYGSMTVYDFNSDGNLDILAGIQSSYGSCDRDLFVLLGDGLGGFTSTSAGTTSCQWGGGDTVWLQDFYGVPTNLPQQN